MYVTWILLVELCRVILGHQRQYPFSDYDSVNVVSRSPQCPQCSKMRTSVSNARLFACSVLHPSRPLYG